MVVLRVLGAGKRGGGTAGWEVAFDRVSCGQGDGKSEIGLSCARELRSHSHLAPPFAVLMSQVAQLRPGGLQVLCLLSWLWRQLIKAPCSDVLRRGQAVVMRRKSCSWRLR